MRNNRGADLTTKASCYHFISGHGVLNLVFAPSKQLRDKSHNERRGGLKFGAFVTTSLPNHQKTVYTKQLTTPLRAYSLSGVVASPVVTVGLQRLAR